MDGNGRWARKRRLPNIMGHRSGVETADAITEACVRAGIKALTLYTFSTENWKRPEDEVGALMAMLERKLRENVRKLQDNNVKFNVIGQRERLGPSLKKLIDGIVAQTAANTGMILTLALSYGGRQEILDAVKSVGRMCAEEKTDISGWGEKDFERFLYTRDLPELDLVIRTSGEMRISNFLLWQSAYAEFYVTDTLWPDFSADELQKAIDAYVARERRFGE